MAYGAKFEAKNKGLYVHVTTLTNKRRTNCRQGKRLIWSVFPAESARRCYPILPLQMRRATCRTTCGKAQRWATSCTPTPTTAVRICCLVAAALRTVEAGVPYQNLLHENRQKHRHAVADGVRIYAKQQSADGIAYRRSSRQCDKFVGKRHAVPRLRGFCVTQIRCNFTWHATGFVPLAQERGGRQNRATSGSAANRVH